MSLCPVCLISEPSLKELSAHLVERAGQSDPGHIMWLNRNVTSRKLDTDGLSSKFSEIMRYSDLKRWFVDIFVRRFFGEPAHRFIRLMQKPTKELLAGYAIEHHHFLKQWVKSCAYILAKTDSEEVAQYEMENMSTEYFGWNGLPSHHEYLLQMGEAAGISREQILNSKPLGKTEDSIALWRRIARESHWLLILSAMHPLELIANKRIRKYGGTYGYFDPSILSDGSIPEAAARFLYQGYSADQSHSEDALEFISRYSQELDMVEECQEIFLASVDAFDLYLLARIERGDLLKGKL